MAWDFDNSTMSREVKWVLFVILLMILCCVALTLSWVVYKYFKKRSAVAKARKDEEAIADALQSSSALGQIFLLEHGLGKPGSKTRQPAPYLRVLAKLADDYQRRYGQSAVWEPRKTREVGPTRPARALVIMIGINNVVGGAGETHSSRDSTWSSGAGASETSITFHDQQLLAGMKAIKKYLAPMSPGDVRLLGNTKESGYLVPTVGNILESLEWLVGEPHAESMLLVYMDSEGNHSGHLRGVDSSIKGLVNAEKVAALLGGARPDSRITFVLDVPPLIPPPLQLPLVLSATPGGVTITERAGGMPEWWSGATVTILRVGGGAQGKAISGTMSEHLFTALCDADDVPGGITVKALAISLRDVTADALFDPSVGIEVSATPSAFDPNQLFRVGGGGQVFGPRTSLHEFRVPSPMRSRVEPRYEVAVEGSVSTSADSGVDLLQPTSTDEAPRSNRGRTASHLSHPAHPLRSSVFTIPSQPPSRPSPLLEPTLSLPPHDPPAHFYRPHCPPEFDRETRQARQEPVQGPSYALHSPTFAVRDRAATGVNPIDAAFAPLPRRPAATRTWMWKETMEAPNLTPRLPSWPSRKEHSSEASWPPPP